MKKFLLALIMLVGLSVSAVAGDNYTRDVKVLPEAARTTISNNFKSKVSVIKLDKTLGHINEYEVILTDGTEISFDNKGNWDNIETSAQTSVPKAFVPKSIRDYVSKDQPKTRIVGIDKERNGYEIELSNGIEMKFDKSGRFLGYDD